MRWCKVCKGREWYGPDGETVCGNEWCGDIKRLRAEVRRLRKALKTIQLDNWATGQIHLIAEAALTRRPR